MSVQPDLSGVPETLRDLVRTALAKDRESRPSAYELLARLSAPRPGAGDAQALVRPEHASRLTVPLWGAAAVVAAVVAIGVVFTVTAAGKPDAEQTPSARPGSGMCGTTTAPALVLSAPQSIRDFLCPHGID